MSDENTCEMIEDNSQLDVVLEEHREQMIHRIKQICTERSKILNELRTYESGPVRDYILKTFDLDYFGKIKQSITKGEMAFYVLDDLKNLEDKMEENLREIKESSRMRNAIMELVGEQDLFFTVDLKWTLGELLRQTKEKAKNVVDYIGSHTCDPERSVLMSEITKVMESPSEGTRLMRDTIKEIKDLQGVIHRTMNFIKETNLKIHLMPF